MSVSQLETVARPNSAPTVRAGRVIRNWRYVLTAIPILMALGGVLLAWPEGTIELGLAWRLLMTVAFALGWAILARIPSARSLAITFLAGSLVFGIAGLSAGLYWFWTVPYWDDTLDVPLGPITVGTIVIVVGKLADVLWPSIPIVLMQVFPTGVIQRWWARFVFGLTLAVFLLAATVVVTAEFFRVLETSLAWPGIAGAIILGETVGVGVLVYRFASGTPIIRRQVAAFGILQILFTAALPLSLILNVQDPPVTAIALLYVTWAFGVVACVFYGMARHHLYDAQFIVRRFALYVLLTVLLSSLFVAVYLLASAALSQTLSIGSYQWFAVVAAVVVVLMVDPLRRRLVSRIEGHLLGDRHRPLRAFARLHSDIDAGGSETAYQSILEALTAAVRAPGAALALRHGSTLRAVASHGAPGEEPLVLPVSYRGELLGEIQVGRRTPGEEFPEVDRLLLEQLVAQAAAQIYGARRDQELAQTRREALTAIADERGRLGRDLHDGLAPLLAGAGLTAEALRRDMTPGSAGDHDAARLAERLRHAAGEVRRIAHGLDPGDINENLAGAVTSYLDSLTGPNRPRFSAHIKVDELPPVVANAAYLVVLEAVNNVIRHAQAHQVNVQVRRARNDLVLRIADDGCGIPRPYVSGLGITSMRKRVEALGGKFIIGAQDEGGTLIQATIPIAS